MAVEHRDAEAVKHRHGKPKAAERNARPLLHTVPADMLMAAARKVVRKSKYRLGNQNFAGADGSGSVWSELARTGVLSQFSVAETRTRGRKRACQLRFRLPYTEGVMKTGGD
jgi:hypothetical protein